MKELQDFQKLVIENAQKTNALRLGEKAPDFLLPNAVGKLISLKEQLQKGSVILKFYRGEWCPLCSIDLRALQGVLSGIAEQGAVLLAISPQNPDNALTMKQKNELGFEVLSDSKQAVIKSYGLQFDPGQDYHQRRDLSELNGNGLLTLPIPATYIIGQDRIIKNAHIEADYTQRLQPEALLKMLAQIKK